MGLRGIAIRLAWLLALATIAVPWVVVARTMAHPPPPAASTGKPTGLVWGERVFTSRGTLGHWLHVRGVAYSVWSGRHPPAAKRLR